MRKEILVIVLLLTIAVITACGRRDKMDIPTTGALIMPEYTSEIRGIVAREQSGKIFLITETDGPIVLEGDMNFDGLSSGDDLTIYCDGVMETYPAQAVVKEMILHSKGKSSDVPQEAIEPLEALGYIFEYDIEDVS